MKKLIISAAAITFAVIANAATVSWSITGVQDSSANKLTSGHTYMFFATTASDAQTQIAAITALAGKGADSLTSAMSSAAWNDTKKATAAGTFSIGTSAAMGGYTLPTNAALELSGGTTYYAYAVIFDTESITDSSNFIVAQGTPTTTGFKTNDDSSAFNKSFNLGSQSSATWYAVGSVPEPTSGLLLLLGVAGL
ncbi:MAG: hypothetical protein K6F94_07230, partial [Bacteroidaceae bacterium]|nr:hypothetical protein [Bacteroidaceae bacterium]